MSTITDEQLTSIFTTSTSINLFQFFKRKCNMFNVYYCSAYLPQCVFHRKPVSSDRLQCIPLQQLLIWQYRVHLQSSLSLPSLNARCLRRYEDDYVHGVQESMEVSWLSLSDEEDKMVEALSVPPTNINFRVYGCSYLRCQAVRLSVHNLQGQIPYCPNQG